MIAISARDVSKRFRLFKERNQTLKHTVLRGRRAVYEEFWALKDVTVEVPAGTTHGLIGENGSGKSTLLKCMARILQPDAGTITTEGSVSALLELGAGFHPELSGRENVFLNGAILGLNSNYLKRKFDEIVEFSGIERFIDTPVKNYSSGMYVRLGFSVAINVEPDILLVDEILAVGDEEFQQKCRDKFSELRERGSTIIIVSHALEMVRKLCDSATWLESGMVRREGDANDVIAAYLEHVNPIAELVSAPAINKTIRSVALVGSDGAPVTRVSNNQPVTVRMLLDGSSSQTDALEVDLCALDGTKIAGTSTTDATDGPSPLGHSGNVSLELQAIPLPPGIYDLKTFWTGADGAKSEGPIVRFEIVPEEASTGAQIHLQGRWSMSSAGERPSMNPMRADRI